MAWTGYWHIGRDGQPHPCHAESPEKCPLGTAHGKSRSEVEKAEERRIQAENKAVSFTPNMMSKKTQKKLDTVERPLFSSDEIKLLDASADFIAGRLAEDGYRICGPDDQSYEDAVKSLTGLLSTPAMDLFIDKNDKQDAERIARLVLDLPRSVYLPSPPNIYGTRKLAAGARVVMTRLHNDWNGGKGKKALKAALTMTLLFKGRCPYCGRKMRDRTDPYHGDDSRSPSGEHIIPVSLKGSVSGTTSIGNTMIACSECNKSRGRLPLKEWMEDTHGKPAARTLEAQLAVMKTMMPYEIPDAGEQAFIHQTVRTLRAISNQLSPKRYGRAAADAAREIELMKDPAYRSTRSGGIWEGEWVKKLIAEGIDLDQAKARRGSPKNKDREVNDGSGVDAASSTDSEAS